MDADPLPPPDADVTRARSLPRTTAPPPSPSPTGTLFEAVGGEPFFERLVGAFYERVAQDPVLLPLYPADDLDGAAERLRMFLVQYWGGPGTYSEQRGHPRLRMRHAPYPVGTAQIEAWLTCMRGALDEVGPEPDVEAQLWDYFARSAPFMRNVEA